MPDRSVPDYLKIEQLYKQADAYVTGVADSGDHNPDELRRHLDPILAMGKAVGRRDALDDLRYPEELEDLRAVVSRLKRIFEQVPNNSYHIGRAIGRAHTELGNHTEHDRMEARRCEHGFEDETINRWLAIADSNVPRETSTGGAACGE